MQLHVLLLLTVNYVSKVYYLAAKFPIGIQDFQMSAFKCSILYVCLYHMHMWYLHMSQASHHAENNQRITYNVKNI